MDVITQIFLPDHKKIILDENRDNVNIHVLQRWLFSRWISWLCLIHGKIVKDDACIMSRYQGTPLASLTLIVVRWPFTIILRYTTLCFQGNKMPHFWHCRGLQLKAIYLNKGLKEWIDRSLLRRGSINMVSLSWLILILDTIITLIHPNPFSSFFLSRQAKMVKFVFTLTTYLQHIKVCDIVYWWCWT